MKLNHKQKVSAMNKMITKAERFQGVLLRNSLAWRKRKWQIMQRVRRQEVRAKYYSDVRKGLRGQKGTA